MTILVLLFLAVVWALVLVPSFWRRQAEARLGDSIGDFRRQLRVLQRAGPRTVPAAYRLSPERLRAQVDAPVAQTGSSGSVVRGATAVITRRTTPAATLRRQRTLRRRRDVFVVLACGTLGCAGLGAVPALHVLWALGGGLGLLLAAYVAVLIHVRNLAAEREMKLRFLPPPQAQEPALLLRRSAN